MMNNLKNYELPETEMDSVTGGGNSVYSFLNNAAEEKIFLSLTEQEKQAVFAQPDRASKRAKMAEFYNGNGHIDRSGASGGW